MGDYAGYAALELHFDKNGLALSPADPVAAVAAFLAAEAKSATDVIVFSHGWNNTDQIARDQLYTPFLEHVRELASQKTTPYEGTPALVAIFWPSQQFVAPGGAGAAAAADDPAADLIGRQLDALEATLDPAATPALETARAQLGNLESDAGAQDAFVKAVGGLFTALPLVEETDGVLAAVGGADGPQLLQNIQGSMARLRDGLTPSSSQNGDEVTAASFDASATVADAPDVNVGEAAGLLNSIFDSVTGAAAQFLNLFTYYAMKERAGVVGAVGVAPVVAGAIKSVAANGRRLHLIGHSFGARLVTSAANAQTEAGGITSLTLLQGAYSHYGMAKNWDGSGRDGAFRHVLAGNVISKFVLVTHSVHDGPVGTWYPLASELGGQVAAVATAVVSKWGGMGGDGAQSTPECSDDVTLLAANATYPPLPAGKLRNVDGSGGTGEPTITGHSDVTKPEIVALFLRHVAQP